ncbi:DUF2844 domain-containing protein [Paraburkholderia sp. J41]|uniref:DUF2844 domain-containing protein n=1 Tax=Paraburkholderia sp. J41 TaxID=2805433 RepID=UPI0039F519B6
MHPFTSYPFIPYSATAARVFACRAALACALGAAAFPAFAGLGGTPMATPAGASVSRLSPASAAASVAAQIGGGSASAAAVARQAVQIAAASAASASAPAVANAYSVQQTTLANGTVVREYLSAAGAVFGVAWNGPQPPDLSALLGSYFPQYVAGVKANRAAGRVRGSGAVEQPGLVVHSGGHMGAFSGQAWLPQALPAGVSAADIQ